MPLWFWGLAAGGLLGVGIGLLIPDVLAAITGALLFGLLGAALGALIPWARRARGR